MPSYNLEYDPTEIDAPAIDKFLGDAIAECQAYAEYLIERGLEPSSALSYTRGQLYALRAVEKALGGDPEMLKSFTGTTFREG
ncbi:hypothetical protein LCGC14_1715360 [marine sediment metagenome]|uniref:Uncharacterized protein n=1 Tax=marine sediment metagenome TaxID=412755 RepID=A0A0F9KE30_9ZZZZ